MTCGSLAEIILDLARGAAVPEASRRSAERHMDGCRACAAAYARQRELTAGLQALAVDAQEWQAPAAMEERLLEAFAARQVVVAPATMATGRWKYALPAAAAIALAVWGGVRVMQKPVPSFRLTAAATQPQSAAESVSAGRSGVDGAQHAPMPGQPGLKTRPPQSARKVGLEFQNVATGFQNVAPGSSDPGDRTATARTAAPPATPVATVEFVRIPSAIGLPDMESGTVVRMELPLTALPEYGLDIAPDAARSSVEADVLVGQDGQPRAIRLVGIPEAVAQDSRSRQ